VYIALCSFIELSKYFIYLAYLKPVEVSDVQNCTYVLYIYIYIGYDSE
jgi:hypothetical protein